MIKNQINPITSPRKSITPIIVPATAPFPSPLPPEALPAAGIGSIVLPPSFGSPVVSGPPPRPVPVATVVARLATSPVVGLPCLSVSVVSGGGSSVDTDVDVTRLVVTTPLRFVEVSSPVTVSVMSFLRVSDSHVSVVRVCSTAPMWNLLVTVLQKEVSAQQPLSPQSRSMSALHVCETKSAIAVGDGWGCGEARVCRGKRDIVRIAVAARSSVEERFRDRERCSRRRGLLLLLLLLLLLSSIFLCRSDPRGVWLSCCS
ncbi:hypothetical protein DFH27DRAFT_570484 [Peziza echinospora]|nr:hypothetical protein DFH27DRAFT_570484 [Peziza echinospora]